MKADQVLYRKWRPPKFADIVGQNAITLTLSRAVGMDRIAHAYLLCGPRGTGKTSTARVLAKALNCSNMAEGATDPDGVCSNCTAIDSGSFMDLIEIDAASNRGIDDMRDLREKVQYSPTVGKYKVYIIDEAHMLTADASNAFLKTLEEPPPYTVFILATTDPDKLPATIVSRCQRFDFKRISTTDVATRLSEIAQNEGVNAEIEGLHTIARASSGSLRDATNLLDRLIVTHGMQLTLENVREGLGITSEDTAIALVKHLLGGNTTQSLELINNIATDGFDLRPLLKSSVELLRATLLIKSGVQDSSGLSKEAQLELGGLAARVPLTTIVRTLKIFSAISLRNEQPVSLPIELGIIELSVESEVSEAGPRQSSTPIQKNQPIPNIQHPPLEKIAKPQTSPPMDSVSVENKSPSSYVPQKAIPHQAFSPESSTDERLLSTWNTILRSLSRIPRNKFDVGALLRSSRERIIEDNVLVVKFSHQSNCERLQEELNDPRCRIAVEQVLSDTLGEKFSLRVEAINSKPDASIDTSHGHLIRAAMNLGGQVIDDAIQDDQQDGDFSIRSTEESTDEMETTSAQREPQPPETSTTDPNTDS